MRSSRPVLLGLLVLLLTVLVCTGYLASRGAAVVEPARAWGAEGGSPVVEDPSYARPSRGLEESPTPRANQTPNAATGSPQETRTSVPGGAPVHGRVLDAETGEPVPYFHLSVSDQTGRDENVATDVAGRYVTREEFRIAPLTLLLADDDHVYRRYGRQRIPRPDRDAAVDVHVPVGPTYRVRFDPPYGYRATDFFASLVAPGEQRGLQPGPSISRVRESEAPDGGRASWVRLHKAGLTQAPGPPWALVLQSEDGHQRGSALVWERSGIQPGLVDVDIFAFGSLRGRVEDPDGDPGSGLILSLVPDLAGRASHQAGTTSEGRYAFPCVSPGDYVLRLDTPFFVPVEQRVRIQVAEDAVRKVALLRRASAGALRGRVVTESGSPGPPCGVVLGRGGSAVAYASVVWGESEGRFEFAGVPAGEHRLKMHFGVRGPVVDPPRLDASAPRDDLLFTLRDLSTHVRVVLDLRDAATGARPVGSCTLWTGFEVRACAADGEVLLDPAAPGTSVPWAVRCGGYAPAFGSVNVPEDALAEVRVEVALEPGWGGRFLLLEEGTSRPVSGVILELDGVPTVASDAEGRIVVRATLRPEVLSVAGGKWTFVPGGPVNALSGRFDEGLWWDLPVRLRK